jgi:hypothetical protein
MEVFEDWRLVLCDFCIVDFGSYNPSFFGLPRDRGVRWQDLRFIKRVHEPSLGQDKYCPSCDHRLTFLNFVAAVRLKNQEGERRWVRTRAAGDASLEPSLLIPRNLEGMALDGREA